MLKKEFVVEKSKKIIDILQDYGFSFVDANKILHAKDVKINKRATKTNVVVDEGDVVAVFYPQEMLEKKYSVIYEDEEVVVIYKQSGIETAGEKGLEKILGATAVHRLDRNTEGLVVFAKTKSAEEKLLIAFKKGLVHKYYVAEVVGCFALKVGVYRAFLLKDSDKAEVKMFSNKVDGSVEVLTKILEVDQGSQTSVLKIELLTGKTHQIRAHLSFLGYPIVGDGKYGKGEINKKFGQKTQKLASFMLKFDYLGINGLDNKFFQKFPSWYFVK